MDVKFAQKTSIFLEIDVKLPLKTSILKKPMLIMTFYLQKYHHVIFKISFSKTNVNWAMLNAYFLVVLVIDS